MGLWSRSETFFWDDSWTKEKTHVQCTCSHNRQLANEGHWFLRNTNNDFVQLPLLSLLPYPQQFGVVVFFPSLSLVQNMHECVHGKGIRPLGKERRRFNSEEETLPSHLTHRPRRKSIQLRALRGQSVCCHASRLLLPFLFHQVFPKVSNVAICFDMLC